MKVFNLTDVPTPVLTQRGLVQQNFAVSRRMVLPGEYVEVEDTPALRNDLQFLLQVGAVSIDRPTPGYVQLRQAQKSTATAGIPVRHVEMHETLVAGVVDLAPPAPVDVAPEAPAAVVPATVGKSAGGKKKGRK